MADAMLSPWRELFGAGSVNGWRLVRAHPDARGVRLHWASAKSTVSAHVAPLEDGEVGFISSASVRLSHGPLPAANRDDALAMIAEVGRRLVKRDKGQAASIVTQFRRGFGGDDAERLLDGLQRLGLPRAPEGGVAARLIDALVGQVRAGRLPMWVLEPSFRRGDPGSRLTANVTLGGAGEHGTRDMAVAQRALLETADVLGLADVVTEQAWRDWMGGDDHHIYVGVATSKPERVKLYAHAEHADAAGLQAIAQRLGVAASFTGAHMLAADFDAATSSLLAIKRYGFAAPGERAAELRAFVRNHGLDARGWLRCDRIGADGDELETSWHVRAEVTVDAAQRWIGAGQHSDMSDMIDALRDGTLCGRVLSSDGQSRTLYTAFVR